MLRHLQTALLVIFAPMLLADEVPQAVKALEHLRPRANDGPTAWATGEYHYDGAGNIAVIGSETFAYDKLSRLQTATVRGSDMATLQTQTFRYDEYGNLTETSKLGQTVSLPVWPSNRLQNVTYDAAGNLTVAGTQRYGYDAVGMPNSVHVGDAAQPRIVYAYAAGDERLFAYDLSTGTTHWTLRGLDNKVLRDFKQVGATWSVERDYVYRDGLLLAALKGNGAVEHYTLDHLGTPRLITDGTGHKIGFRAYWPFGEEWSPGNAQEGAALKFTGHERDADPTGGSSPLDYMHARYYGAGWGRFLSVDPMLDMKQAAARPQMWNRYSYVTSNPVLKTDPDGRIENVQQPGFTKPLSEAGGWADQPSVSWAFNAEGVLLTLAADELVIGPAVGKAAGAVGRFVGRFFGKAEETVETGAKLSRYEDMTTGRSVVNRGTNVSRAELGKNLEANGFAKTVSKDGKVTIFEKDGLKYTVRGSAKSTGGPTAEVFKDGKLVAKIRLELPR